MKWNVNRFTEEDWNRAERIERLYMSIVQPNDFSLNSTDKYYLEILDKAYPIIKSKPEQEALQLIYHLENGKWCSQIEQIYRDAMRLYDFFDVSADMVHNLALKQLTLIANDMTLLYQSSKSEDTKIKAAEVAQKTWLALMKETKSTDPKATAKKINVPRLPIKLNIHPAYKNAEKAEIIKGGKDE
jgi:hypothetical protein